MLIVYLVRRIRGPDDGTGVRGRHRAPADPRWVSHPLAGNAAGPVLRDCRPGPPASRWLGPIVSSRVPRRFFPSWPRAVPGVRAAAGGTDGPAGRAAWWCYCALATWVHGTVSCWRPGRSIRQGGRGRRADRNRGLGRSVDGRVRALPVRTFRSDRWPAAA